MSYGCYNRKPLWPNVRVQDGWFKVEHSRMPTMVTLPDPMEKTCQYSKDDKYTDPGCRGCKHNQGVSK